MSHTRIRRLLTCTLVIAAAQMSGAAEPVQRNTAAEWPRWRGPAGNGIAAATATLPDPWPAGDWQPAWQVELGEGWSSPVVADGRVFVTDRRDMQERIVALDAVSGKLLWEQSHPVDFDPHAVGLRHGNGPKSTPLVVDGKVYSLGIAGWLECHDAATGRSIWKLNLPAELGKPKPLPGNRAMVVREEHVLVPIGQGQGSAVPLFGYTGSLALDGQRLIVPVGQPRGGTIMALDKNSGEPLWQALDEHVSYSSPIVAKIAGRRQVVAMTGPRVVGLDIESGKLLWSYPFQIQYDESISTPAVAGDMVFVTGDGRPLTALAVKRRGDEFAVDVAWTRYELSSYLSSMVAFEGHVYGMSNHGEFHAVRIADGQVVWSGGDHGFYCSPIVVGKRLVCLNETGDVVLLAADPAGYQSTAPASVAQGGTWTMPAVAGRQMFIRGGGMLRAFSW